MADVSVSDRAIQVAGDIATVSLIQELKGRSYETSFDTRFRYLRLWKRFDSTWKVIATAGVEITP
jgi:ketosteroid isomerase-like protein